MGGVAPVVRADGVDNLLTVLSKLFASVKSGYILKCYKLITLVSTNKPLNDCK